MKYFLPICLAVTCLSGCGVVTVSTSTGGPNGPGSGSSPGDGAPRADDPRLADLYSDTAGLTYKTVSPAHLDITKLQSMYMMPKDRPYEPPPACGPNPDKEWIKEWPSEAQLTNQPVAAWIQSRINRSYAADLDGAYTKYRDAWKAFDDELSRKQDEALSRKSFYERLTALHAAFADGEKKVASLPGAKGVRRGMLHTIAKTIVGEYEKEKVGWALHSSGTLTNESLRKGLFANLRAWGDETAEKKELAALTMTGALPELLPALPAAEYVAGGSGSGGSTVNTWLRWPQDVDLAQAPTFIQKADAAFAPKSSKISPAVAYPTQTIEDMKAETKEALLAKAKPEEPSLVVVHGAVVALEPAGDGARVTLEMRVEYSRQECTESGPITRVSPDGYVHRKFSKCRIAETRETQRRFVVTAKAWPKEVDLGDWVDVSGDLESVKTKGNVKSSTVDVALTARFVGCFAKGDPLDTKAKDYKDKLLNLSKSHTLNCSLATW